MSDSMESSWEAEPQPELTHEQAAANAEVARPLNNAALERLRAEIERENTAVRDACERKEAQMQGTTLAGTTLAGGGVAVGQRIGRSVTPGGGVAVGQRIGRSVTRPQGAYGVNSVVYQVVVRGKECALKAIICAYGPFYAGDVEQLEQAVRDELRQPPHSPHLLRYYTHFNDIVQGDVARDWPRDVETTPTGSLTKFMLMPLLPDGNLQAYVRRHPVCEEATFLDMVLQLLKGVISLIDKELLHRDIKLDNVLVRLNPEGGPPLLLLADFGTLRPMVDQVGGCTPGNPQKVAPELRTLQDKGREEAAAVDLRKAEVWAVGALCFDLLGADAPYDQADNTSLPESSAVSAMGRAVVRRMLTWEAPQRLSALEAAQWVVNCQQKLPLPREAIPAELKLTPGKEAIDFGVPPLGGGAFADVRRGTYKFSGDSKPMVVAFKIFRGSQALDRSLGEQIIQEARMLHRLQHPHLVELFGILEIPEHGFSLVMELADGGSLRDVLSDDGTYPFIPWNRRVRFLTEIATGMDKLHSLSPKLIHRDLKAANVLLSCSGDLSLAVAKVCDFGVAKTMQTMQASTTGRGGSTVGTLAWNAPETFMDQYSRGSDVFAFGVTAFEVISRKFPFAGLGEAAVFEKVGKRFQVYQPALRLGITEDEQRREWEREYPLAERRPDLSAVEPGCPTGLLTLVQRCWSDNPAERPSARECIDELNRLQPERDPLTIHSVESAHITDTKTITKQQGNPYVEYKITWIEPGSETGQREHVAWRRYSEFNELCDELPPGVAEDTGRTASVIAGAIVGATVGGFIALGTGGAGAPAIAIGYGAGTALGAVVKTTKTLTGNTTPPFPPKTLFSNTDPKFIRERRELLDAWIKALVRHDDALAPLFQFLSGRRRDHLESPLARISQSLSQGLRQSTRGNSEQELVEPEPEPELEP
eukprot:COSAG02_NODE_4946_length_4801_cov_2.406423_1_plen_931_part_00